MTIKDDNSYFVYDIDYISWENSALNLNFSAKLMADNQICYSFLFHQLLVEKYVI